MKKFLGMVVLFLSLVCSVFSQQPPAIQNTNGWTVLKGTYGYVDFSLTTTYFKDTIQAFEISGVSKDIATASLSSGLLALGFEKDLTVSRSVLGKISAEFFLSKENNTDSIEVYMGLVDSTDNWWYSGKKYLLHPGLNTFVWDIGSSNISTFNKINFSYQFRTRVPLLNTGGVIFLKNILKVVGEDSSVIDLGVKSVTAVSPMIQTPKDFKLEQNYPNPFNPSTTIRFSIPKTEQVSLIVYNALGQEVKNLVSETKVQGSYEVNFDASNLSSGIYFYRLQAGNFAETKRMNFLK